jgi:hypothetical protein
MPRFCVAFAKPDQQLTLTFETYDTPLAGRWYDLLAAVLAQDPTLREADRLYDFPGSSWDEQAVVARINECIRIINEHQQCIAETASVGCSRSQLNILHKSFEDLRGGVLTPTAFWHTAPADIRAAVNEYNVQIHRLEDLHDARADGKHWPHMVITFQQFTRLPLLAEDYAQFDTLTRFGEVYVNYCEVGKALLDVYKDGDTVVGDDNIRPLRYYSPEMLIKFYDGSMHDLLQGFWAWFDQNQEHLNALGFHKQSPDLSLGHLPVARLLFDGDRQQLINTISGFDRVDRVYIL